MTTSTHPETTITVHDDVPMITLTREFAAPVERVFRAHTDPDLYARWCGPHDISTTITGWDCRTGGSWSFDQFVGDDTLSFYGSFHEIRPDELIVQTFTFAGFPDGVTLERATFSDLGAGRTRLVATSLVDSFEARDAMVASGMEVGIREGYDALDDLLGAEAPS